MTRINSEPGIPKLGHGPTPDPIPSTGRSAVISPSVPGLAPNPPASPARSAASSISAPPALRVPGPNSGAVYDCDVVVIGAGMAGITAARELLEAGKSVKVIEAQDRIGGRIQTDTTTFGTAVDTGAAWIHSADVNPLTNLALGLGIRLVKTPLGDTLYVGDRIATPQEKEAYDRTIEAFENALKDAANQGIDLPADQVLPNQMPFAEAARYSLGPMELAADLENSSSLDAGKQLLTREDVIPEGGMARFFERYAAPVPVDLSTPATKIRWSPSGATVETADGQRIRARKVITTASTGVIDNIQFDPPLPQWKQDSIRALPMGLMNKVTLKFPPGVLPHHDNEWVEHLPKGSGVEPMGFLMRPHGEDIVVAFVAGSQAERLAEAGDEATLKAVLENLREFCPQTDAGPLQSHVTHWEDEPWVRGAYSVAKPGEARARERLAKPLDGTLFFAGEAAARSETAQRLNGAYETGRVSARSILHQLGVEDAMAPGETTSQSDAGVVSWS